MDLTESRVPREINKQLDCRIEKKSYKLSSPTRLVVKRFFFYKFIFTLLYILQSHGFESTHVGGGGSTVARTM